MQEGPTWTCTYSQAHQGPSGTWEWLVGNGWLHFVWGKVDANAKHPVKPGLWCWENTRGDSAGSATLAQLMLTLEEGQGSQWMSGAQRGQSPKAPTVTSEFNESPELNDRLQPEGQE